MRAHLNCPALGFRYWWWTVVCVIGAVIVIVVLPLRPADKATAATELTLRVFATRHLQLARAFNESSRTARRLLGVPTIDGAINTCAWQYQLKWEELSVRGQVEYGMLLAESGRPTEAQRVFSTVVDTNKSPFPKSQSEVVESTKRWVRTDPGLWEFAPSNSRDWVEAARVLADIYGGSPTGGMTTVAFPQKLGVLQPAWYLPVLRQKTGAIDSNEALVSDGLQAKVVFLSMLRWGLSVAALFLLGAYGGSLRKPVPKTYAFRYLGSWGDLTGLSVYMRGVFYRYWWDLVVRAVYFAILPFWLARAAYHAVTAAFLPVYGLARLTPTLRLVQRGCGLDARLLKEGNILGITALLWLCQVSVWQIDAWVRRWAPLGHQLTDTFRMEICLNPSTVSLMIVALVSLVVWPLGEEIVYRGLVYTSLRERWGVFWAAAMSAAVFAAIHHYAWLASVEIFLDGLLWAYAFEETGSLWPGLIVHGLSNLLWFAGTSLLYRYTL
jgi:membrane protease YdiL (CAAX protease family)